MARTFKEPRSPWNRIPDKVQKAFKRDSNNRRIRIVNRFEEKNNDESNPNYLYPYLPSDRKDEYEGIGNCAE
jgi:hypothetical protein